VLCAIQRLLQKSGSITATGRVFGRAQNMKQSCYRQQICRTPVAVDMHECQAFLLYLIWLRNIHAAHVSSW
jgi:hypothetical protein